MSTMCHIATFSASCHSGFELQVQHSHQGHPTSIKTAETSMQGLGMTKPQIRNKVKVHLQASSPDKQTNTASNLCRWNDKNATKDIWRHYNLPTQTNALLGNIPKITIDFYQTLLPPKKGKFIHLNDPLEIHDSPKKNACLIIKRVVT